MDHIKTKEQRYQLKKTFFVAMVSMAAVMLLLDPSFAVTVAKLQDPIKDLKTEIFGGWMMVVKIGAAAAGIVLSAFRGTLAPFGIGAGISAGIILFDKYLGNGADGALI